MFVAGGAQRTRHTSYIWISTSWTNVTGGLAYGSSICTWLAGETDSKTHRIRCTITSGCTRQTIRHAILILFRSNTTKRTCCFITRTYTCIVFATDAILAFICCTCSDGLRPFSSTTIDTIGIFCISSRYCKCTCSNSKWFFKKG
jgi:hypothetical protein